MSAIAFPSLGWIELLQTQMNSKPEKYRRFGTADCRFVIRIEADEPAVDAVRYGVVFEEYGCTEAGVVASEEAFDPDFVIAGPRSAWAEMVVNIAAHGKADMSHTINRLTLIRRPLRVEGAGDQVRLERFSQYNYTIQAFLDEGGDIGVNVEGRAALEGVRR